MSNGQDRQGTPVGQDAAEILASLLVTVEQIAASLQAIADVAVRLGEPAAAGTALAGSLVYSQAAAEVKSNVDKETQAIAALLTIGPIPKRIAEQVGVNRSTLYRWPRFMAQLRKLGYSAAAEKSRRPRGTRSADGTVDGIIEEDDEQ